jgi:hypothetical protein
MTACPMSCLRSFADLWLNTKSDKSLRNESEVKVRNGTTDEAIGGPDARAELSLPILAFGGAINLSPGTHRPHSARFMPYLKLVPDEFFDRNPFRSCLLRRKNG